MTIRNAFYLGTTALFALPLTASGVMYFATEMPAMLGLPAYFWSILGTWKLLGVAALLVPGLPLLKEWAYAGFFFTLTGAATSHLLFGDAVSTAIPPLVIGALGALSYLSRPESRRLASSPTLPLAQALPSQQTA
jgi:hypothetical protein